MTKKEIEEALRIFIDSGSANGIEKNRKTLLRLVPVMAEAAFKAQEGR